MDLVTPAHIVAYGHAGGWWFLFPFLWFFLIFGAIWFFTRRARRFGGTCWGAARGRNAGESVLAERFARGEISETEYRDRLGVLRNQGA